MRAEARLRKEARTEKGCIVKIEKKRRQKISIENPKLELIVRKRIQASYISFS